MLKKFFSIDKSLFTLESPMGKLNLFALLFPMMFESVTSILQGTVNTAVLSNYSENAVAAVGSANSVVNVIVLLGTIISMGSTVVISNGIGEGKQRKIQELTFSAVAVCVLFALILTPVLLLSSRKLMMLLNLRGEILENAVLYFRVRMVFFVFLILQSILLSLLRCYGFPKYTFIVGVIANAVNLVLNIYVIYFPKYAPVTGVAGVALSVGVSNLVGICCTFFVMKKKQIRMCRPKTIAKFFRHTKSILQIGLPAGLSGMSFSFSQMITTSFVALLGAYAISAKVYYMNILSYVYLFSINAGNANALMVGRCYGAGDYERAERMNKQLIKITRVVNLAISLAVLIFSRGLLSIFTGNELVFRLAIGVFAIDIITEQARAVSHIYEYALRAVGDIMFSTVIMIISCWALSIGLAYILAIKCGMGLIGCFIGVAADESVRAIVTYLRWKTGKWRIREGK